MARATVGATASGLQRICSQDGEQQGEGRHALSQHLGRPRPIRGGELEDRKFKHRMGQPGPENAPGKLHDQVKKGVRDR